MEPGYHAGSYGQLGPHARTPYACPTGTPPRRGVGIPQDAVAFAFAFGNREGGNRRPETANRSPRPETGPAFPLRPAPAAARDRDRGLAFPLGWTGPHQLSSGQRM